MTHEIRSPSDIALAVVNKGACRAVPARLGAGIMIDGICRTYCQSRNDRAAGFMCRNAVPISFAEDLAVNGRAVVRVGTCFVLIDDSLHRPGIRRFVTRP